MATALGVVQAKVQSSQPLVPPLGDLNGETLGQAQVPTHTTLLKLLKIYQNNRPPTFKSEIDGIIAQK